MLSRDTVVYVAGHRGMVGSALVRQLRRCGCTLLTRTHSELDLTDQQQVATFFAEEQIDVVILAAARVGGIHANNSSPAEFIYQNLMIEANVIHQAWLSGIQHLLFLGSSCIYPKFAPQPIREKDLLTGLLEPTNEPYAVAKIAGIKMCEAYNRQYGTSYRAVMPTNLFGPGDNYDLTTSHVVPAMLRKYHLAQMARQKNREGIIADEKKHGPIPDDIAEAIGYRRGGNSFAIDVSPRVILWGSGTPRREFLHVDDMAAACLQVLDIPQEKFLPPLPSFVNVGTGRDITIKQAAAIIADCVGFTGETVFDSAQPDGTPQKLLDTSRISDMGWKPRYDFRAGILDTYTAYLNS